MRGERQHFDSDEPELIADTMTLHVTGRTATARFVVDVNLESEDAIAKALTAVDADELLVDFADILLCASVVFAAMVKVKRRGVRVVLLHLSPEIREALDVLQLSQQFVIEDSPEA